MFDKGNKVRCVQEAVYGEIFLIAGEIYEVKHIDQDGFVQLQENDGFWAPQRFVLAEGPEEKWSCVESQPEIVTTNGKTVKVDWLGYQGMAIRNNDDEDSFDTALKLAKARWKVAYHSGELEKSKKEATQLQSEADEGYGSDGYDPLVCVWKECEDGSYHTACGDDFEINNGAPSNNNMNFCHCCGRVVKAKGYDEA